ncbi:hypothetical protein TNIN_81671 [Trichonephila inaurata madagascariensis]|uniref:Uncharacterized protein n=1 Tax=Trichonephila inaurata madagascariensis TaxID=2747483 RepID=A0A8X6Y2E8_9ARAC|nr:hypothetical protein TNIN_81671 [Trichonephila inaurata madagascariensis]
MFTEKKGSASFNAIQRFTCLPSPVSLLDIEVCEATDDSSVEINSSSCPTNSIPSDVPLQGNPVDEKDTNDLHFLEEEGHALNVVERNDLMILLNES